MYVDGSSPASSHCHPGGVVVREPLYHAHSMVSGRTPSGSLRRAVNGVSTAACVVPGDRLNVPDTLTFPGSGSLVTVTTTAIVVSAVASSVPSEARPSLTDIVIW